MALTVHTLLVGLALLFAVASLIPPVAHYPLLAVAVILLSVALLVP